jgi:HPt (histidine-containing phosphotransfer) domain-containing protein
MLPIGNNEKPTLSVVDIPPFDAAVLEDLVRLSKDEMFVERLLRGFQSDTQRLQKQIIDALVQRKYQQVKDAAHALKGGAASVGATQLTQLATRLEKSTHETLRVRAAAFIEEFSTISSQTFDALEQFLERRRANRVSPK